MDIHINLGGNKHGKGRRGRRSRSNSPDAGMMNSMMYNMGQQQHPPPMHMGQQHPPPMQMGQHPPPYMGGGMQQQQFGQQGYVTPNMPPMPSSQHYGNHGSMLQQNVFSINAAQALGFGSEQELQHMYNAHYNQRLGGIQAHELVNIMNNTPSIQQTFRIHFGPELCKIMLAMLDRSKDGIMQYPEFHELLQCLAFWQRTFQSYDTDRSNFMEAHELGRCILEKYGYKLSQAAMTTILKRYSRAMDDGRVLISFEDFVALSVRLRAYTEAFRARDRMCHNQQETGSTNFAYDDFLQCVLCL